MNGVQWEGEGCVHVRVCVCVSGGGGGHCGAPIARGEEVVADGSALRVVIQLRGASLIDSSSSSPESNES